MKTKNKAKITSPSSEKTSQTSEPLLHANKQLLIDVDNLGVVIGNERILDDISFCIHSGEFIGLIGPNGAGKTTLLKVILGLWSATSGKVAIRTGTIGYIPQRGYTQDNQVPISVLEVVKLGSKGSTVTALDCLTEVRMQDLAAKRINELSGGQQQRVLIAKALASRPSILILDEPTTGIDEQSQEEFYKMLAKLQTKGIAVIMVSHDVDIVLKLVSRVICLNRTIVYDGKPEHFDADKYLPKLYGQQHRVLHHQHEGQGEAHDA